MKNFARVMGLLFGSVGAQTYPKSGQIAPLPAGSRRKKFPEFDSVYLSCWPKNPSDFTIYTFQRVLNGGLKKSDFPPKGPSTFVSGNETFIIADCKYAKFSGLLCWI